MNLRCWVWTLRIYGILRLLLLRGLPGYNIESSLFTKTECARFSLLFQNSYNYRICKTTENSVLYGRNYCNRFTSDICKCYMSGDFILNLYQKIEKPGFGSRVFLLKVCVYQIKEGKFVSYNIPLTYSLSIVYQCVGYVLKI